MSVFTLVIFGSAIIALGVGLAALRKRPDPMAWPLALLLFAVAAWAIPHAISLGYTDVERIVFWQRMRYPGTVFAPVLYLVVALRYADYERWLSRRVYAGLVLVPLLTIVIVWTNPSHGLFWTSLSTARINGIVIFAPAFGPWYWLNLGYLYLLTLVGLGIFANEVVYSNRVYRKQAVAMFLGGIVPLTINVAVNAGLGPDPRVDFTTTALAITGILFALALFYLDLLEVQPIALDQLFWELEDGVVVVGPNGEIRDFNPAAGRIIDDIEIGQPAADVFPTHVASDDGEIVVEHEGTERVFRTRSTTLTDDYGQGIGRIVYLNDVTDLVEREQRISILNRVLRHNVRNELNVVIGRLELLETAASSPEEHRDDISIALEKARSIVSLSEKARRAEETLQKKETTTVVSAATILEQVVANARERHPDAVIEYTPPEDETSSAVQVVDSDLFEHALMELVDNAVVHNDRPSPQVTVRLTSDSERVHVIVADDGPGIPELERRVIEKGREAPLEHGSGLGLWIAHWTASLSSGDLSFAENEPRGSLVTLSLPSSDET